MVSWLRAQRPITAGPDHRLPLYLSLVAVELLLLWFVRAGVRAKGGSLRDLVGGHWHTWRDSVRDVLLGGGTFILLSMIVLALIRLIGRWPSRTAFLLPTTTWEALVWIVVAITAGICEELIYRGYLQRQLCSFTGSLPAAISLQAAIFGSDHLYQGWKPALVTAVLGLVFGLLAGWRRSIIPGAIAHSALDIVGGLLPH